MSAFRLLQAPENHLDAYNRRNYPYCHACKFKAHSNKHKAESFCMPSCATAAQTRFQLLEFPHVCTLQRDRPGRSV
jgi:hypothetical protein